MNSGILFIVTLILGLCLAIAGPALARLTRGANGSLLARTIANEAIAGLVLSLSAFKLGILSLVLSRAIGILALIILMGAVAYDFGQRLRRRLREQRNL